MQANLTSLIQSNKVHGSLYTNEEVFREEIEKIWSRVWVYVGHESEVPNKDDFILKHIGLEEVIMTRGADGEINLLHNRCPHRGNRVCVDKSGNNKWFKCQYHGWMFKTNGALHGYPYPQGFQDKLRGTYDMAPVARVAVYRGLVFGCLSGSGPSLEEYLGGAKDRLDLMLLNSPSGELEVTAGFIKHRVRANWKILVENETDGYHPQVVHASIFDVVNSVVAETYRDGSPAVTRSFGNGHAELDVRPEMRRIGKPMHWFNTTAERLPQYTAEMNEAYGEEKAREVMIDGIPHLMIFPNLFIAEVQLFVLQPVSMNETIQHVTALQFKGAKEFNRRLRQQTMGSVGPAGFLLADDGEMYERTQRGLEQAKPEWVYLGRGQHRETEEEDGNMIGDVTDDMPSRRLWQYYKTLMAAA